MSNSIETAKKEFIKILNESFEETFDSEVFDEKDKILLKITRDIIEENCAEEFNTEENAKFFLDNIETYKGFFKAVLMDDKEKQTRHLCKLINKKKYQMQEG